MVGASEQPVVLRSRQVTVSMTMAPLEVTLIFRASEHQVNLSHHPALRHGPRR